MIKAASKSSHLLNAVYQISIAALYQFTSAVDICAVQNLWLAARVEGLGVGWVSIFKQAALQEALGIPKGITPIAYLCVGYVSHFYTKPELEAAGWLPRLPIEELVYFDQWGNRDEQQPLIRQLIRDQAAAQVAANATVHQPATGKYATAFKVDGK